MSAGWSERDKIIGSIGVAMNNFMGNGQRLSFDWNFGKYYRSFQIGFTEPWLFDTPTLASVSIFDTKRSAVSSSSFGFGGATSFDYYAGRSQGVSLRLGRRLNWPDNYFRLDGIYRFQRQEYTDVVLRENVFTSSSITGIFSRNSLNRPEFPTAGSQVSLTSELAGGPLYGNVGFHKHQLDADWFLPTFGQFVILVGFKLGYLDKLTKDSQIPYLDYFYMGGEGLSNSIALRGYEDPLRVSNPPLHRTMLKYQAEFRVPISPNPTIFALMFAEAGNTWPDLAHTNPRDLRRAAGVGARLFMPLLGIIGFDYAYGFDYVEPITGRRIGRWKPHFVFGKSF
jgi:outer membrane protein insertion porin family